MNHTFSPNINDSTKCRSCKWTELDHTDQAKCSKCDTIGNCNSVDYGKHLLCSDCEKLYYNDKPNTQINHRVIDANALIDANKQIDQSINIQSDIFNAKTVAIVALRDAIIATGIENPQFELAQVINARYIRLKEIIFSKRQEITDSENEIRAIQQHYNDLAKTLKADERAKLKLKDVNYTPTEPTLKKPKAPTIKSVNKTELMKWALELEKEFPALKGKALAGLQTVSYSQKVNPEGAYNVMKLMLSPKN